MQAKDWIICLIEPNKFEGKIMLDLLRSAGAEKIAIFTDSAAAMQALELYPANIVIAAVESSPIDGVNWTRAFRRNPRVLDRKAPIYLTSRAFSRSLAEECRHAGVNALIGKPISGKILIATVKKVLDNPRTFIDAEGYVGPCRRAGIVTAGAPKQRRKSEADRAAAAETLAEVVSDLGKAITEFAAAAGSPDACHAGLGRVQAYAVNAGDGPMMRACAAFTRQLSARDLRPEAAKAALAACMAGLEELASTPAEEEQKRDAIAERVRLAVAAATALKAA